MKKKKKKNVRKEEDGADDNDYVTILINSQPWVLERSFIGLSSSSFCRSVCLS